MRYARAAGACARLRAHVSDVLTHAHACIRVYTTHVVVCSSLCTCTRAGSVHARACDMCVRRGKDEEGQISTVLEEGVATSGDVLEIIGGLVLGARTIS